MDIGYELKSIRRLYIYEYVERDYFHRQYYGIWLDHYEPTKPISTYMVGVLVGNLQNSTLHSSDTNISIYTYDEYLTQTAYVLEETPMLYDAMENYTEVKGEMEKVDILALPDFDPDGAENWGLNSYRYCYYSL